MAGFNVGAIEGTLTLDRTAFQRGLAEARAEAKRFSEEKIAPKISLADDIAKAKLDELRLKLARLDHERVNVKVDVDRSSLSRIEGIFGKLGRGVGGIPLAGGLFSLPFKAVEGLTAGLQKIPGLLEQVGQFATTAFSTVAGTINDLRTGATTVTQVLGSLLSGLISVVASGGLALVAFGALVVVFAAVASAVVSLVAALAALAASLAAAAAGAVALFIGAFAAAIPVLGVVVAFFTRLAAVVKAHQAAQQAAKQASQQHTQALQAQHQALGTLQQAQQNLKDQTVAAFQAMKQSAVDYQHALLGVEQSRNGIEDARLSLRRAKQDLKDFLQQAGGADFSKLFQAFTNVDFNPESARKIFAGATGQNASGDQLLQLQEKLQAVRDATTGVKTANQGYQDSLSTLAAAEQKRNQYLQQGIAAYKPYDTAVRQVAQAQDRLQIATGRVSAAQRDYNQKLQALSGTEQGFLGTLDKILKTFGDIAKAVSAPIFQGIEKGFGSIQKLVSDPGIQRGLVGIGRSIGGVIARFAKTLDTKPWRTAITQFLNAGASLTKSGGKLFTGFLTVLREIAQAALPHVISGVKSLAGWFTDLGKRPGAIKSAVDFLVRQFQIWLGVAKALGGLVVAFLKNAAGSGGRLATHIASILNHWTKWLNKHPGAVKQFFDNAVKSTEKIAHNLGQVVGFLGKIIDAVNWLSNARKDITHAIFGTGQVSEQRGAADSRAALTDISTLQRRNISAQVRGQTEQRLRQTLDYLASHFANLSPQFENIRKQLDEGGHPFAPARPRPAPRSAPAHGHSASVAPEIHLHAHGIEDPQHFIAKSAAQVAKHPAFRRARTRDAQKRGK